MTDKTKSDETVAPKVDEGRRALVKTAGKATVAAAATTLVLASGVKAKAQAVIYVEDDR